MTQVWDRADEFDTTPGYGERVLGYVPVLPSTSFTYGRLCQFDGDGDPHANGLDGAAPDAPVAFAWREQSLTDCQVEAWGYVATASAFNPSILATEFGVLARVQNGTVTGGTTQNVRLDTADCYAFTCTGAYPSTSVTFTLARYNSGTKTTLGTFPLNLLTVPLELGKPVGMLLRVVDSGGNPQITASVSNISVAGSANPFTGVVLFSGYNDASASKLTGAGWPGFVLSQDRDILIGGGVYADSRHKMKFFEAVQVSGGVDTIVHRDEFERVFADTALEATDDYSKTGKCVQGVMAGGLFGASSYANAFLEAGTNTADAAEYNPASGSQTLKFCPSYRPADSVYRATPEVEFDFSATGSGSTSMGVIARAQGTHTGTTDWTGVQGYMLQLTYDGAAWDLSLYRLEGDSDVLLASMTPSTVALGTSATLALQCEPVSSTFQDGPVILSAFIDGGQETLVLASPAPSGVTVTAGSVTDSSSSRITQGAGEALCFDTSSTRRITLYTWDEGTYTAGPLPAHDQASIAFTGEGSSAATLTVDLASPIDVESEWYTARQRFDSGHTKGRATKSQSRRTWPRLQTVPLSDADRTTLLTFWRARNGGEEPFTWTNPQDDTAYVVRFLPGSYAENQLFKGVWVVSFGLQEVL